MDQRQRLRDLLIERSLRTGEFTLSSGARSSYYIDARTTTMSAEGQALIGEIGFAKVRSVSPSVAWAGGLTLGSDPIAYSIAHHSWQVGDPIDAFTIRKAPKDHGTGRRIEGGLPERANVFVVEDTLTSGRSALEAVSVLEDFGARILGVLALVDREEGGRSAIEARGYEASALFTASELLEAVGADPSGA